MGANVTIETFCLSQLPCTFEMFESLPQKDLQSFLDFLEVDIYIIRDLLLFSIYSACLLFGYLVIY